MVRAWRDLTMLAPVERDRPPWFSPFFVSTGAGVLGSGPVEELENSTGPDLSPRVDPRATVTRAALTTGARELLSYFGVR